MENITHDSLPAAIGLLLQEVRGLKQDLESIRTTSHQQPDEHFNIGSAASFLGISTQTIYQNIKKIPHSKRFGKLYFMRSELELYLETGRIGNPKPSFVNP